MSKPVVVVMYEYFYPGYKAGGPIQSLVNMIAAMQQDYEFKVITTVYDLNETAPYPDVLPDTWNKINIDNEGGSINVWYTSSRKIKLGQMREILQSAAPDIIFVNGLFTQWFAQPLWLYKLKRIKDVKLIVSPRGMLQPGALRVKGLKKKIYLGLFKTLGLFRGISWHVTYADEKEDVKRSISKDAMVSVAGNIPKQPVGTVLYPVKKSGEVRLVYLSIITEKKNLLLLLRVLQTMQEPVLLDIYGPVKEEAYWQLCEQVIGQLPEHIQVVYKSDVPPYRVQQTLQEYHGFISLTKGENFGHALYESLSVGRPVITSYFTPWNGLQQKNAGFNVNIDNGDHVRAAIGKLAAMNDIAYRQYCDGAYQLACEYYYGQDFKNAYHALFSGVKANTGEIPQTGNAVTND